MTHRPSWPSLYNPAIELFPIQHTAPVQPGGSYLYNANEIFRFTLYWTLIFHIPAFLLCALYAFFNLTFPPRRDSDDERKVRPAILKIYLTPSYHAVPSTDLPHTHPPLPPIDGTHHSKYPPKRIFWNGKRNKPNEKRSRVTFALLVCLAFALFAVAGAVVGSAVVGYALAGLWRAGKYNMSTWVPFFGGLIQSLVSCLGLWPTVIDIV